MASASLDSTHCQIPSLSDLLSSYICPQIGFQITPNLYSCFLSPRLPTSLPHSLPGNMLTYLLEQKSLYHSGFLILLPTSKPSAVSASPTLKVYPQSSHFSPPILFSAAFVFWCRFLSCSLFCLQLLQLPLKSLHQVTVKTQVSSFSSSAPSPTVRIRLFDKGFTHILCAFLPSTSLAVTALQTLCTVGVRLAFYRCYHGCLPSA